VSLIYHVIGFDIMNKLVDLTHQEMIFFILYHVVNIVNFIYLIVSFDIHKPNSSYKTNSMEMIY
jgi:hypothetical protein